MDDQSDYISLATAAALTEFSEKTIRRAIANGDIPAYRHGASLRVKRSDLDLLFRPIPTAVKP